ncbi:MAG: 2,4-dihydroxyhept-2-ene-1,7-dioic acid aldolase [Symploca sp. SIO3E6]|nr:2,4-dihydroxyhept-2-ene-1,7-dioic acid aldolase [Caldora sp. SIO3E6]
MSSNFKQKIRNNQVLLGSVVTIPSSTTAEIMSLMGFDWLWIDMEHAPLSLEKIQEIMQAAGNRCTCLVRVPCNDRVWMTRVLDSGCDGIIVPQVNSAEEAEQVVNACKYAPEGNRSVTISRAQNYGINLQAYYEHANENMIIVLQIEHIEAVRNIESIIDVPGFDAIVIGPFDLSSSLGKTGLINDPEVQEAIATVKQACLKKGIPIGIYVNDAPGAISAKNNGFTFIAVGIDFMYFWKSAKQTLEEIVSTEN